MKFLTLLSLGLLLLAPAALRADDMGQRIITATKIVDQKQGSMYPIPSEILAHARGIAIGTVTKAGIGIGGQGGEGIVVVRNGPATWTAPVAYNTGGGSVGAQLGFTTIRYIIILNTEEAVRMFTSPGKVTWDATASGTAGADTGTEGENTANLAQHAIIIYKETGGIFGGATFGGSSIEVKDSVNQAYYGEHVFVRDIMNGKLRPPRSMARLTALLSGQR